MGHSWFGHIIIKVLMTIPVSATLPPKMWTKNVAGTGSYLALFGITLLYLPLKDKLVTTVLSATYY